MPIGSVPASPPPTSATAAACPPGSSDDAIGALQEGRRDRADGAGLRFSVPSTLKAWIDMCAAPGSPSATPTGPGPAARPAGIPGDGFRRRGVRQCGRFASGYLRQVLRFIGIEDVRLVGAERVAADADAARESALAQLDNGCRALPARPPEEDAMQQSASHDRPDIRSVSRVVRGMPATDGAGVELTRVIGQPAMPMLDPFLLLDAFRSDRPDAYIAGFPSHPHRGFETVTYLLAGRMRHKDNAGHEG